MPDRARSVRDLAVYCPTDMTSPPPRPCSNCVLPANAATRPCRPDSRDARICSFECTFCVACAEGVLAGRCPNCGGEFAPRPRRPAEKLVNNPASTERVFHPGACAKAA